MAKEVLPMNYSNLDYLKVLCSLITKFLSLPRKVIKLAKDIREEQCNIYLCVVELNERHLDPATMSVLESELVYIFMTSDEYPKYSCLRRLHFWKIKEI
jgi:hypothetical protein